MSTVKVSEFRAVIEHLETKCNRDYHACVGAAELADWAIAARRIAAELEALVCRRASLSDEDRRVRALDRCASLLAKDHTARLAHCDARLASCAARRDRIAGLEADFRTYSNLARDAFKRQHTVILARCNARILEISAKLAALRTESGATDAHQS